MGFLLFGSLNVSALTVPRLTGPVVDKAGILSSNYQKKLNQYIRNIHQQTGNQLQVLTVVTLEGESIEQFSMQVVDEWKLGSEKSDNGILFLVALKERRMRIEVGQGLEGDLTDLESARIIDGVKSFFRSHEYDAGVNFAITSIASKIGADPSGAPRVKRKRREFDTGEIIFLIIFLLFFIKRFSDLISFWSGGRRRNSWSSSRGWGSNFGWGGSSSSSSWSSGGGGWSGGGGGFSGGGSSGSW